MNHENWPFGIQKTFFWIGSWNYSEDEIDVTTSNIEWRFFEMGSQANVGMPFIT